MQLEELGRSLRSMKSPLPIYRAAIRLTLLRRGADLQINAGSLVAGKNPGGKAVRISGPRVIRNDDRY